MTGESEHDDQEETWQEFFEENRIIPAHPNRSKLSSSQNSFPFRLTLKSLEGIYVPPEVSIDTAEFQVLVTFYDAANAWYFGSTWKGPLLPGGDTIGNKAKVVLDEPLYFHSSIRDYTIVLVIEIAVADGNTYQSIGWSMLRIFSNVDKLPDTKSNASVLQQRLTLYHGSPSGLLLLPEPIEEYAGLQPIADCGITYSLQSHFALEEVLHLIPENVLISGDDRIPGVSEVGADSGGGLIDILRRPKLQKLWPCYLNKLCIYLFPTVEQFEEKLCKAVNEDRRLKHGIEQDGSEVTVAERRLLVGVHNGWTFVKDYHIGYLQKSATSSTGSVRSDGQGKQTKFLSLRSRIELDEMVNHPLFAIVCQVQYVLNVPVIQPELPTGKKARSRLGSSFSSVPLSQRREVIARWLVWVPFERGSIENKDFTLELAGGPGINPANSFCLTKRNDYLDQNVKSIGKIQFLFTQIQKKRESIRRRSLLGGGTPSGNTSDMSYMMETGASQAVSSTPFGPGKPPLPGRGRPDVQDMTPFIVPQQAFVNVPVPFERPQTEVADLSVLPQTQQYTPILATTTNQQTNAPTTLTRAAYAKLHSAGFPAVTDSNGSPPFVVDPGELLRYKVEREEGDSLQSNEIILQFLAISMCKHPVTFFTFQFYRFPQVSTERLCLRDIIKQNSENLPCVLVKCDKDGKPTGSAPGLQIKYTVDPAYMQPGEKRSFVRYLHEQRMYIDVWDGDSLMLIGSTSVELKYLMRQGQSAVQASLELDITSVEYAEDEFIMAGDMAQDGKRIPTGANISLEGKLYMRLANVGYASDFNPAKAGTLPQMKSTVIMPSMSSGPVNLSGTGPALGKQKTAKAKLMTERDSELASLLFTRRNQTAPIERTRTREADAVRKRKLERMQAVRQIQDGNVTNAFVLQKEEKVQRQRDLQTIKLYRERCKHEGIINILEDGITTHRTMHASLGKAEFFEFALKNPYSVDQNVEINFQDRDIAVITDAREWRYFKILTNTKTAVEENMINTVDSTIQVYLKGNETLHIPFKLQSFTAEGATPELGPPHPLFAKQSNYMCQSLVKDTGISSRTIKISFVTLDQKPIAILALDVEMHPHSIDQTFRFSNAEQSFLKKSVRLPPWRNLTGSIMTEGQSITSVVARCTDPHVICETRDVQENEPQDVLIKVPCGPSPNIRRFFVVIYADTFCASPSRIWQFYVHSLQRLDITATQGQPTTTSVVLRGTQSSRLVQTFTSHQDELQVTPADPFMLMANAVQEIRLTATPKMTGNKQLFVNVVDSEFHQLVKSWLVCISSKPPYISKTFEVRLKCGGGRGSNKSITYTNPYPMKKSFIINTNRADLLRFKDNAIMLGGGQTHKIILEFLPQQFPGIVDVLVFINDKDGKNEETFGLKANYVP
eukprot:Seg26.6 transcript_id=Seg26.6/GoldUCD/mRNA.D3Y31 product=Nephrocystin-4 protein_id=Seg26.6/GoldUCD/D3Y31